MLETVSLFDGLTASGIVAVAGSILKVGSKYGGQIVAIFARLEVYHKFNCDAMSEMNARMERIEKILVESSTLSFTHIAPQAQKGKVKNVG